MRKMPIDLLAAENDEDTSWAFNDINLTMVIIILFYAMVFAVMVVTSEAATQGHKDDSSDIEDNTTQLASFAYYGDEGMPQSNQMKGFPKKDILNSDIIITENRTIREGMEGDAAWEFAELDNIRDKKFVKVYVSSNGSLTYQDEPTDLNAMKVVVDKLSSEYNVFLELHISAEASVGVYNQLRDRLWNQSDALHWRFITE